VYAKSCHFCEMSLAETSKQQALSQGLLSLRQKATGALRAGSLTGAERQTLQKIAASHTHEGAKRALGLHTRAHGGSLQHAMLGGSKQTFGAKNIIRLIGPEIIASLEIVDSLKPTGSTFSRDMMLRFSTAQGDHHFITGTTQEGAYFEKAPRGDHFGASTTIIPVTMTRKSCSFNEFFASPAVSQTFMTSVTSSVTYCRTLLFAASDMGYIRLGEKILAVLESSRADEHLDVHVKSNTSADAKIYLPDECKYNVNVHGRGFHLGDLSELHRYAFNNDDGTLEGLSGGAVQALKHIMKSVTPPTEISAPAMNSIANSPTDALAKSEVRHSDERSGIISGSGYPYSVSEFLTGLHGLPGSDKLHFVDYKGLTNDTFTHGITAQAPKMAMMRINTTHVSTGGNAALHAYARHVTGSTHDFMSSQESASPHSSDVVVRPSINAIRQLKGSWLHVPTTVDITKLSDATTVPQRVRDNMFRVHPEEMEEHLQKNASGHILSHDRGGAFSWRPEENDPDTTFTAPRPITHVASSIIMPVTNVIPSALGGSVMSAAEKATLTQLSLPPTAPVASVAVAAPVKISETARQATDKETTLTLPTLSVASTLGPDPITSGKQVASPQIATLAAKYARKFKLQGSVNPR